jgi:hypothetical protein
VAVGADHEKVGVGRDVPENGDGVPGVACSADRRRNRPRDVFEPPIDHHRATGTDDLGVELGGSRRAVVGVHDLDARATAACGRECADGCHRRAGGLGPVVADGDMRVFGPRPPRRRDREHGAPSREEGSGGDARVVGRQGDEAGPRLLDAPRDALGQRAVVLGGVGDLEPRSLAGRQHLGGGAQAPARRRVASDDRAPPPRRLDAAVLALERRRHVVGR